MKNKLKGFNIFIFLYFVFFEILLSIEIFNNRADLATIFLNLLIFPLISKEIESE